MKKQRTNLSLNKKMIAKLINPNKIWGGTGGDTDPGDPSTNPIPVMTSSCPTMTANGDNLADSNCLCDLQAPLG